MIKNTLLGVFLLFSIVIHGKANLPVFSDSATISILTCSPGPQAYEKFGHTGIRLYDEINNIDIVFNYGLFDFNTKNFYGKFIAGKTDYQLGIAQTNHFLSEYKRRNSSVWEQHLNLSSSEKKKLINALFVNYEPENRIYRYNFVFDNCATRPRDIITKNINGVVRFNSPTESRTFRDWVAVYAGSDSWLMLGIDIVFGRVADVTANRSESMFLPEILMKEFRNAEIKTMSEAEHKPLVSEENILVEAKSNEVKSTIFSPFVVFSILALLVVLYSLYEMKKQKHLKLLDSFLLITTGSLGIIVFYLAFISEHPLVKSNFNLLWLSPFNVLAGIFIWMKRMRVVVFFYQTLSILACILALTLYAFSVQSMNIAFLPIIVILVSRYFRYIFRTKKKVFKTLNVNLKN